MKNFDELKNIESGRKCVIIGGGCSVSEFDFKSLDKNIKRIAVNRCFVGTRIDYQIYSDNFFIEWNKKYPIEDHIVLISHEKKSCERTDFSYDWDDIVEGFHTGFYALQVAVQLGFTEIYLIGFDYYDDNGKLHYYEGKFNTSLLPIERKFFLRQLHSGRLIADFDRIDWPVKIYNCNTKSQLKRFDFKKP